MEHKPTHRLTFGNGRNRRSWIVMAGVPRLGNDGVNYYNCITTHKNKLGIHYIASVPETRLKPLKET